MPETTTNVRETVRKRFGIIASSPEREKKFPIGPENAKAVGYDAADIDQLPRSVTESFVGVTNVLRLGEILPGQTVVDLGCGAGLDCLLAARRVGPSGEVIGVSERSFLEMLSKAGFVEAKIAGRTDYSTSEFTKGATVTARKPEAM